MITDLHTRIWDATAQLGEAIADSLRRFRTDPWDPLNAGPEHHDQAMQPVSVAVLHGLESGMLDASIPFDRVAAYVARRPDRLVGFAGIDPLLHDPVKRLGEARDHGLVGVTLSPGYQGYHPTHSKAMALFEACEAHRVPVLVEPGGPIASPAIMEFDQPVLLDEVARQFPELRLVLGSFADPFVDQAVTMLRKHPNVFAELSGLIHRQWALYHVLVSAHQRGVMGQVLFGTGYPRNDPEQAIVTLYSVNTMTQGTHLPAVPREQLRAMVQRDTLSVLGLTPPGGPDADGPSDDSDPAEADDIAVASDADDTDNDTDNDTDDDTDDDTDGGNGSPVPAAEEAER